jgi:hypothetical protein
MFSLPSPVLPNLTLINDNYNPKTGFVNSKLVVLGKIDSIYRPVFSDFPVKTDFLVYSVERILGVISSEPKASREIR